MTRAITITSGKGGVGKTSLSVNLAISLAKQGYRVCLFDADLGLANINIMLRLSPQYTLADVIYQHRTLKDILIRHPDGIDIIPGSSGIEQMVDLSVVQVEELVHAFKQLDDYDFFIFDTSSGATRDVLAFCMAAYEVVLVVTPEPTSLTDAYSLLKILSRNGFQGRVRVVVNQAKSSHIAKLAYKKFKEVVGQHLFMRLLPLGIILRDDKVSEAIKHQEAFVKIYPDSMVSRSIEMIAKRLAEDVPGEQGMVDLDSFWRKCLDFIKRPIEMMTGVKPSQAATARTEVTSQPDPVEKEGQKIPAQVPDIASFRDMESQSSPLINKLIDAVMAVSVELRELRSEIKKDNGNGKETDSESPAFVKQTKSPDKLNGSVKNIIGDVIALKLEDTGIGYELAIPGDMSPLAVSDNDIKDVFGKVVDYAVRMTPAHRSIKISLEDVQIQPQDGLSIQDGYYCKLTVTDQGPGTSQKVLDELLVQADKALLSPLGEANTLLQHHGGCLVAKSRLEVGNRYDMYIPLKDTEERASHSA